MVFVPLPGPMLKILAADACGVALNWNAFEFGALNENGAGVAAGAVAGPPNALNVFDGSVELVALNENEEPVWQKWANN